jgi:large subunit ribosomal protein L21e
MASKKAIGKRAKSRDLMRQRKKRVSVNKRLQEFPVGSMVHIKIDSSIHSGMPHMRYQGKTGEVTGRRGLAYIIKIKLGNKTNELIVNSAHLKLQTGITRKEKISALKEKDVVVAQKRAKKEE